MLCQRLAGYLLASGLGGGGLALAGLQFWLVRREPAFTEVLLGTLLIALAATWQAYRLLHASLWQRRARWAAEYANGLEFVSDDAGMPNRNHVLFELRSAIPDARASGRPFVVAEISLSKPRGEAPPLLEARLALERKLVDILKRLTRKTDLLAELSDGKYCVVLLGCNVAQSARYLGRLPQMISAQDGGFEATAGIAVRLLEYDMEIMFATDVLTELARQPQIERRSIQPEQRRGARRRAFARPGAIVGRDVLEQFLREHYRVAARHGLPLSVAAVTVTDLAAVRAACGEPASRLLLRQVAALAEQTTRPDDLVASLSADSVAIVFPGLARPAALAALSPLQDAVAKSPFHLPALPSFEVKLRVGVAELSLTEATSPERMLARAEDALTGDQEPAANSLAEPRRIAS